MGTHWANQLLIPIFSSTALCKKYIFSHSALARSSIDCNRSIFYRQLASFKRPKIVLKIRAGVFASSEIKSDGLSGWLDGDEDDVQLERRRKFIEAAEDG